MLGTNKQNPCLEIIQFGRRVGPTARASVPWPRRSQAFNPARSQLEKTRQKDLRTRRVLGVRQE